MQLRSSWTEICPSDCFSRSSKVTRFQPWPISFALRAGEGHVGPRQGDCALASLQADLVFGVDADLAIGAGDGDGLVGEELHRVTVCLEGMAARSGDAAQAPRVGKKARFFARRDGQRVGSGGLLAIAG